MLFKFTQNEGNDNMYSSLQQDISLAPGEYQGIRIQALDVRTPKQSLHSGSPRIIRHECLMPKVKTQRSATGVQIKQYTSWERAGQQYPNAHRLSIQPHGQRFRERERELAYIHILIISSDAPSTFLMKQNPEKVR